MKLEKLEFLFRKTKGKRQEIIDCSMPLAL